MDLGLRGKAALVTGASRGIGRGIAAALVAEGCNVALCARTPGPLEAAARELDSPSARAIALPADVTDPAALDGAVELAAAAFGRLDIVVANAGGSRHPSVVDASDDDWNDGFARNVLHAARLARLAHPHLRASRGRFLIVASIYGRESGGSAIYNAMKAAEISLATHMSKEWAADGITVNALCPGSTAFEGGSWGRRLKEDPDGMAAFIARDIPGGRFGTVEEVAAAAVFLLSAPASWITGVALPVDGGQSRSNI